MSKASANQKMLENEVVFRQANEQVQKDLKKLRKMAARDGDQGNYTDEEMTLHFFCECADEKCRERIVLSLAKYNELHQNIKQFVIVPGHEIPQIERTVQRKAKYAVAEKFDTPPKKVLKLQQTDASSLRVAS